MRVLKIFAVVFFVCSCFLFCVSSFQAKQRESGAPWIRCDAYQISVSVEDDRSVWLNGITAGSGEDADLTDQVQITHVGKMNDEGELNVTYTVFDSYGHSAELIRTVKFTDYTVPQVQLLRIPVYGLNYAFSLKELILVTDVLEGDITDRVRIVRSDLKMSSAGNYQMILMVQNSYGISITFQVDVVVM